MKTRDVGGVLQVSLTYDTRKKELLSTEAGGNTKNYYYDSLARPTLVRHTIDGVDYNVATAYDAGYSYVKSLNYPSNLTVGYAFGSDKKKQPTTISILSS